MRKPLADVCARALYLYLVSAGAKGSFVSILSFDFGASQLENGFSDAISEATLCTYVQWKLEWECVARRLAPFYATFLHEPELSYTVLGPGVSAPPLQRCAPGPACTGNGTPVRFFTAFGEGFLRRRSI